MVFLSIPSENFLHVFKPRWLFLLSEVLTVRIVSTAAPLGFEFSALRRLSLPYLNHGGRECWNKLLVDSKDHFCVCGGKAFTLFLFINICDFPAFHSNREWGVSNGNLQMKDLQFRWMYCSFNIAWNMKLLQVAYDELIDITYAFNYIKYLIPFHINSNGAVLNDFAYLLSNAHNPLHVHCQGCLIFSI